MNNNSNQEENEIKKKDNAWERVVKFLYATVLFLYATVRYIIGNLILGLIVTLILLPILIFPLLSAFFLSIFPSLSKFLPSIDPLLSKSLSFIGLLTILGVFSNLEKKYIKAIWNSLLNRALLHKNL